MAIQTILVTGGTGFVGSHVIAQLLAKDGYKVRATARKAQKLRDIFPSAPASKLEIVEVPNLTADHSEALKGVDAVIHCASPSFNHGETTKEILEGTYHGTVDIITTAIKLGIKKIISTSSGVAMFEPGFTDGFSGKTLSEKSWCNVKYEDIDISETGPGAVYVYQTSKTVAEKKIWELADENPSVDITVIIPSVIFGPLVPNFPVNSEPVSIGTNFFIQALLDTPDRKIPPNPLGQGVDVRDVARAHVLALSTPSFSDRVHKRLVVNAKTYTWTEIVKVLKKQFPAYEKRLPSEDADNGAQMNVQFDDSFTKKVLPFVKYIPFEQTLADSFETILDWEKRFKA